MTEIPAQFIQAVGKITNAIQDEPVNARLGDLLNERFGPDSPLFLEIEEMCRLGVKDGWLCTREAGGTKFGRVVKPGPNTHDFSVDVVEMTDVIGPHHRHPKGEIDMIMPLDADAKFDQAPRGWLVYGPNSAHYPTVTGGRALVLYLLPDGEIEFTRG